MLETGHFKVSVAVDGNHLGDLLMLLTEHGYKGKAKLVRTTTMADYLPAPQAEPAKAKAKPRRKPAARASHGEVGAFIEGMLRGHSDGYTFRVGDLIAAAKGQFPANSIRSALNRMIATGKLSKANRGSYRVPLAEAAE